VGFPTQDPATGRLAYWVTRAEGARASRLGYEVFDTPQVMVRHLDEVVRMHAYELLELEEVAAMVSRLRERAAQTVEAVVPEKLEFGDLHQILRNLLRERVSIRDLVTILERLAHCAKPVHPFYLADRFGDNKASIEAIMLMEISAQIRPLNDPMVLTEMVRVALARQICAGVADAQGTLDVVQLSAHVEQTILDAIQTSTTGQSLVLPPATREAVVKAIAGYCLRMDRAVVLCDPRIRPFVKQLMTRAMPRLTVLSHAELHPQFTVHSVGTVSLVES
jgi:flagellar biosynthesis protein FlhA